MEHTITAIADTFLKKRPVQSTELANTEKLGVEKGKVFPVEEYKTSEGGHFWVKLGYGAGEWYIFDSDEQGHWSTTWESDEQDTLEPVAPSTEVAKIIATPGAIDWSKGSIHISKYFTVAEVTLNDSRRYPKPNSAEEKNILVLAKELDKLREDWGSPLTITSWFRPSKRNGYAYDINKSVGGVSDSQHIYGRSVDIRPASGDILKFQAWVDKDWYGALGWGARRGFVHLDTRNGRGWKTGGPKGVRWFY
ncbi:MAG: D-Ala-D-Ala carboxypeptidase family metallohydrolase [Microcystaceae cyanobacterium]